MKKIDTSIIERVAPIIVTAIIIVFLLVILLVISDWIGDKNESDNCLKDKGKEICNSYGYGSYSIWYELGGDIILRCLNERDVDYKEEFRFLDTELKECGYK